MDYWITYGDGKTVAEHEAKMLAELASAGAFHDLVWDWEATPPKVILMDKTCVVPNSPYDYDLKNVVDKLGRPCGYRIRHSKNRLVVQVEGTDLLTIRKI